MANLDDARTLEQVDPKEMRRHIAELPDQVEAAWRGVREVSIPTHYAQARNIVILGMGGSAIGGELAAALAESTSTIPIEVRRDYGVPHFVNKDSLVIGVSYSGNTEETLEGFREAAARGAKLLIVTTGGEIASLGRKFQVPIFPVDYGSQPRAAFGYLFTMVLGILSKLRYIQVTDREIDETVVLMRAFDSKLAPSVPTANNLAKTLASKLKDKVPMVMGSGVMAVVAKRWKTQLNENAKMPAVSETMPELCHNMIVGMERVWKQREQFFGIFLQSAFLHPRNQLRMSIIQRQFTTARIANENLVIHPSGTVLSEALQMIQLGDYVSYYLAILGGADPTPVAPIQSLKDELAKQS